jgi:ribosomal protein S28E/S33
MRASDIRNIVSAIYGPVPLDQIVEYLQALRDAQVISQLQ